MTVIRRREAVTGATPPSSRDPNIGSDSNPLRGFGCFAILLCDSALVLRKRALEPLARHRWIDQCFEEDLSVPLGQKERLMLRDRARGFDNLFMLRRGGHRSHL